jgi:hypothetical protein
MLKKTLSALTLAAGLAAAAYSQQAAADPVGGAIIGGAIGAAVGGPPGAAVGAILGTAIGSQPYYYRDRRYRGAAYGPDYGYAPRYYEPAPAYYGYAPSYYARPPVVYSRPDYGYEPRYAKRHEDRRYSGERHYQRDEAYRYR